VTSLAATGEVPAKRSGVGHWLGTYRAMVQWEVTGMRLLLPLTVVVQVLIGAGMIVGIAVLFHGIPARSALYLSTGAAVVTLITVGVAVGPQLVVQQKQMGTYDFVWSLPVPRSAAASAWITLNVLIALPGMVVALLVALARFDIDLDVSWSVVPAVALTVLCGTLVGYAMAHGIPNPEITNGIAQVALFTVIGFSPINFPPENLPAWLASLHRYLPFESMANVVRAGLTEGIVHDLVRSYAVLVVWSVACVGISAWALRRH
jgi:ABC-2 type transport system permease protein